jgi:hypothetical protein
MRARSFAGRGVKRVLRPSDDPVLVAIELEFDSRATPVRSGCYLRTGEVGEQLDGVLRPG